MAFRDFFGRRPPPPAPAAARAPTAPIALVRARPYQPVPTTASNPIDAAVTALWLAYQRDHRHPSWTAFLAELHAGNTELTARLARTQTHLAEYRRMELFRP